MEKNFKFTSDKFLLTIATNLNLLKFLIRQEVYGILLGCN